MAKWRNGEMTRPAIVAAFVIGAGLSLAAQSTETVSLVDAATLGSKEARVAIIEYSDFHCPFCRRHTKETLPLLKKEFVDTGRVLYAFRHAPSDMRRGATEAAVASVCATRQGKFWELHDRLFSAPRPVQPDGLESHARAAGVDTTRFRTCMKGIARDDVRVDSEEAARFGMAGTPGFLLGAIEGERVRPRHRIIGAEPYEVFKKFLDGLLTR